MYESMGDYPKALEYHTKALEIRETLYDKVELARTHYNISFPLYELHEIPKALDHLNIGVILLNELMDKTSYNYLLLKAIKSRINTVKRE